MVTCLSDMFFPEVGVSTVRLLRRLGVSVDFPAGQTCCGQPLFNSGYHAGAARVGARMVELFKDAEHVVVPSGSCAVMLKHELPAADECCGFGGSFSVRLTEVSSQILDKKLKNVEATGAACVVACDAGCLMQLGGGLRRRGSSVRAVHLAELIDGERR